MIFVEVALSRGHVVALGTTVTGRVLFAELCRSSQSVPLIPSSRPLGPSCYIEAAETILVLACVLQSRVSTAVLA